MENTIETPLHYHNGKHQHQPNRIEDININNNSNNECLNEEDKKSRLTMSSSFSHINIQNPAPLTIFLLINTMIGSGILNQPHVFEASGVIGGLIGFVIAGLSSWYGLLLLTEAGVERNVLEYGGLAFSAYGRNGERVCDLAIIILAFGAQLSYILIVGQTISDLLNSWGCHDWLCLESTDAIIAVTCFVTPICMFRHFGHLAWLSIFSIFTIVTIIFLTLIGGPLQYQPNKGAIKYFNINGFLSSFGSIIFALSCASANFQAYISTETKSQNFIKWKFITGFATFGGALMCFIMGLSGYLSFRDCTGNNILDNFPQKRFDFFQVMICVHLILYIPVNFVIMRYSICKMALNKKSELLPFKLHTLITVGLLAFTTFITVLIGSDGLSTVFNFTGGIGGSINCFVLPSLIYIKVMPKCSRLYNIAYLILFIGIFIMISVPLELIVSIVRKTNTSLPDYC